jgi:hypothetical protein
LGDRKVVTKIRFLREKGVPLYPKFVLKNYAALFSAALRIFGSWSNALIAAGLEVPDSPRDGRRGVLRALRDALEQQSENDLPEKLKLHAVYYFGSLQKAKPALKTDRRVSAGWSKAKIIAMIVQRQRSGKPLGYAAVRRDNPRLVSACRSLFWKLGQCSACGWDLTRIGIFTVSGGNEQSPPREIVLGMATYLTRPCPQGNQRMTPIDTMLRGSSRHT